MSPYVYVGNNSVNYIDPTGMDSVQAQQLNSALQKTHEENKNKSLICLKTTISALDLYLSTQGETVPTELTTAFESGKGANGAIDNMNKEGSNFEPVSAEEAFSAASNGAVVIAGIKASGHGHIDVVGGGYGPKSGMYGDQNVLMIGNSGWALKGSWQDRGNVANSFGSSKPTYYKYNGFTPRANLPNQTTANSNLYKIR